MGIVSPRQEAARHDPSCRCSLCNQGIMLEEKIAEILDRNTDCSEFAKRVIVGDILAEVKKEYVHLDDPAEGWVVAEKIRIFDYEEVVDVDATVRQVLDGGAVRG